MASTVSSVSRHTMNQLKFLLPGGLVTYHYDSYNVLLRVLQDSGWSGLAARAALVCGAVTVLSFAYVLALPILRGEIPDYRHWRLHGVLSRVIPIMTTSIIVGFTLLAFALANSSSLGYLEAVIAALGLYALTFGLVGLLPAPKVRRR